MVYMVADYQKNGTTHHKGYAVPLEGDHEKAFTTLEKAVMKLAKKLESEGKTVSCITVCPGATSFKELHSMTTGGPRPGCVYLPYLFT